jgi:hypothetical protein
MRFTREDLPCWTCQTPQASDVRHCIGQFGELNEAERSLTSGLPIGCCRIRSAPMAVEPQSGLTPRY